MAPPFLCKTLQHTPPPANKSLRFASARASSPLTLPASKLRRPSLQPRFEISFDIFGEETAENSVFKGIYHVASGGANGPLSFFLHNWFPHLISCTCTSLWPFLAMFLNPVFPFLSIALPFPSLARPPRPDFDASSYEMLFDFKGEAGTRTLEVACYCCYILVPVASGCCGCHWRVFVAFYAGIFYVHFAGNVKSRILQSRLLAPVASAWYWCHCRLFDNLCWNLSSTFCWKHCEAVFAVQIPSLTVLLRLEWPSEARRAFDVHSRRRAVGVSWALCS